MLLHPDAAGGCRTRAGFYLMHLLMSAVHKRVLVTHREQRMFEVAMSVLGCTLAIKVGT